MFYAIFVIFLTYSVKYEKQPLRKQNIFTPLNEQSAVVQKSKFLNVSHFLEGFANFDL